MIKDLTIVLEQGINRIQIRNNEECKNFIKTLVTKGHGNFDTSALLPGLTSKEFTQ